MLIVSALWKKLKEVIRFFARPVVGIKVLCLVTVVIILVLWTSNDEDYKDLIRTEFEVMMVLLCVPFTITYMIIFIICYFVSWGPLDSIVFIHNTSSSFIFIVVGGLVFRNTVTSGHLKKGYTLTALCWLEAVFILLDLSYLYQYSLLIQYFTDILINRVRAMKRKSKRKRVKS